MGCAVRGALITAISHSVYGPSTENIMSMRIVCYTTVLLVAILQANRIDAKKNAGPVSSLMEDLSFNTASISDEMTLQLNNQIERMSNTLLGQVEVILSSTMDELSEPLFVARKKLNSEQCDVMWTMDELKERIDYQLRNCTHGLMDLLDSFKESAHLIVADMEQRSHQILNLPNVCQLRNNEIGRKRGSVVALAADGTTATFTSGTSCFIEQIADLNAIVAERLHEAKTLFVATHRVGRQQMSDAEQCATETVHEVIDYLDVALEHC